MSDGSLSQDEIDALLAGAGGMDFGSSTPSLDGDGLSEQDRSSFLRVMKEILGSQSSNLSMLVGKHVEIGAPQIEVQGRDEFLRSQPEEIVEIRLDLREGVRGDHLYLLDPEGAIAIAGLMMGQDGVDLNEAAVSALQEALSQFFGPASTTLGDKIGATIMTDSPDGRYVPKAMAQLPQPNFVTLSYPISIEDGGKAKLKEIFTIDTVREIVSRAFGGSTGVGAPANQAGIGDGSQAFGGGGAFGGNAMPQFPSQQAFGGQQTMSFGGPATGPSVQPVQFANLAPAHASGEHGNIGLLMDVYMEMTVELGRTRKLIKEILGMGEGTIIELDKLAGEPVDILVNHKLIAKGEVVVIDENFGVRVTEIVSPMERMRDMT